jgi:hypothetical protein
MLVIGQAASNAPRQYDAAKSKGAARLRQTAQPRQHAADRYQAVRETAKPSQ